MPSKLTVRIITRHSADCPDRSKGADWKECECLKSLLVYDGGGSGKNRKVATGARSWKAAEAFRADYVDNHNPYKIALERREATEAARSKPIAEAIADYIADMRARSLASGTTSNVRAQLSRMAESLKPKPVYLSDVTIDSLSKWRATWVSSDGTAHTKVSNLKTFFTFAVGRKWISESPADPLKRPKVSGGKTAVFSDEQLNAIAKAAEGDRLTSAMFELLRWSGCGISDACKFSPAQLDANGVWRFERQKTKKLSIAKLPAHVVPMLKSLGDRPFLKGGGLLLKSETREWQDRFQVVFAKAGITEMLTASGRTRRPHLHALRDTAAVSKLRQGVSINSVALMLGDTIATVEKHYRPFCQELEQAHIAELAAAEQAEVAALPKRTIRKVSAIS
jgi:site-specific recombinase XerD